MDAAITLRATWIRNFPTFLAMDPTRFDKEMSSLTGVLKVLQHAVRREHGPVHECAFELPEMNATIYDELFLHGIDYIYA